jgi:hypothetical protein
MLLSGKCEEKSKTELRRKKIEINRKKICS